jgi:hypothetical protein
MLGRKGWRVILVWLAGVAAGAATASGEEPASGAVDYVRDVKSILRERCYACHGALKQENALRLDTAAAMREAAVIVPADVDASLLLGRVSAADPGERMPPEGPPLSAHQIATLRAWIEQGAAAPVDEQPESDPRDHWSFRAPRRPPVPVIAAHSEIDQGPPAGALENPIDAFVAQRHRQLGLAPQPAAEKSLLLRRVYLDLIGLPPGAADLQAFLADDRPDAYERVVQRLLESPQYGERWARHWMDVWRYSDWYGRRMVPDVWNSAPQVWRWRDWIVRSLNQDQGYDTMVRQMLAADEICPEDYDSLVATSYLVRNWYALNPNDWMRNNVEHTAKAFLGLTFNCAHCHDHKYDPISQVDYFRFRAFFEPIAVRQDRWPGEADPGQFQEYEYSTLRKIVRLGAVRIYDKSLDAPTWFYTGGDERNRVSERGSIAPGLPAFLAPDPLTIEPVVLPAAARYPALHPAIQQTILADCRAAVDASQNELAGTRAAVEAALPALREALAKAEANFDEAATLAERSGKPGALAGRQSLLLEASSSGRRILQNGLPQLPKLDDGATVSFQLKILQDAHVNFQLARDVQMGLTASYVGFVGGRIVAYQPGSFQEFDAGHYRIDAGQDHFLVTLRFQVQEDRCLLTVQSQADEQLLVADVPVALNGWNPHGNLLQAISFDARAGSVAVIDEVRIHAPPTVSGTGADEAPRLAYFDFEAPRYHDGLDASGIEGWVNSSFSQAPATSIVSTTACSTDLLAAAEARRAAQRAVLLEETRLAASESRLAARVAEQQSVVARLAAERRKYGLESSTGDREALAAQASSAASAEREAAVLRATADVQAAELAQRVATAKPADDANRAQEIAAAQQQLVAAQSALDKAQAATTADTAAADYSPLSPVYADVSSGRRSALADWLASPDNPLTARVAVNHIWMRHFQRPLVDTVYDFGRNGTPPSHPELLDWLAVELMESGWSMKHLHRLIVTSHTYRRSSAADPQFGAAQAMQADPENRFLWRMPTGRMEAEVVRDSLLLCAGRLDLRMGGQELENSEALSTRRRSLYYSCHPELDGRSQFGMLFDAPDALECYRRTRTVIPQQALALTNSQLVHDVSADVAAAIWNSLSPQQRQQPQAFISAAYLRILSRLPGDAEQKICETFLSQVGDAEASAAKDPPDTTDGDAARRESLVRALLNHNDFITIR